MSKVRVRFAPSPTGNLHIGSARIALFNYLFARANGGKNILRIEDTDFDRSADIYVDNIRDGLQWLGITYDEGPIHQSSRLQLYQEYAQKILAQGHVYKCYCTEAELAEKRKIALSLGKPPKYDGHCKCLTAEQVQQFEANGQKPAIRFEVGQRKVKFHDLVRGDLEFDCSLIGDFVIIKSNGSPSYNFAAVVDDALMKISHVIRGEDHISNTPKQILLYEALGFTAPQFAHISMILGPDRTKLSKRHGAKSISEYREEGFLKEAILNLLMLMSWSPEDHQEIMTLAAAEKVFRLEDLAKSPAVFDIEKLKWLNGQYIRALPIADLTQRCLPFLRQGGVAVNAVDPAALEEVVESVKDNLTVLSEIVQYTAWYFENDLPESPRKEILAKPETASILESFARGLAGVPKLNHDSVNALLDKIIVNLSLKKGQVLKTIRLALTGRSAGPELWKIIRIFGKDKCQKRSAV
ncbi:MAG: glutamate--tRNA ligase [Candidatus Margulisiibacteriota bacterium]